MPAKVLTVAESDSSGSMGIQADIKTILALGGYGATAISAVIAQNTKGSGSIKIMEPEFVAEQMRMVIEDIGIDAIKTGILATEAIVDAVSDVIDEYQHKNIPIIVDPAVVNRQGKRSMDEGAVAALKRRLFLRTTVLTPNLKEAELLSGMPIQDIDDMRNVADIMRTLGVETVLLKAGQVTSKKIVYLLATEEGERIYERDMVQSANTLGAGCTLSSAIATSLGQGLDVYDSVERSLDFLHSAIEKGFDFGTKDGPINHAFDIEKSGRFFSKKLQAVDKI